GLTGNDPFIPVSAAAAGAKGAAKGAAAKQKNAAFLEGRARMVKRFQESPILPRLLGEQGYVSLQTGKWWMGPYQTGGFTEGMTKGGRHGDEGLDIGRKTLAPLTDFISRAKKDGKPFFAWYAPMMPHDPHTPPERLLAKYRDKSPTPQAAKYHAMVEWFDETIGEIRAHLEKEGLSRDTIILYVADNGWIPRTDKPSVDFERSKQSPFDGGVRTPIMVSWPGRIKPAMLTEAASAVDIMPTLLKLAGAPVPADGDGLDLLDDAALKARPFVAGQNSTHDILDLARPAASLRYRWLVAGDLKLIVSSGLKKWGGKQQGSGDAIEPPRLFDLKADPYELRDLAAERPDDVKRLMGQLDGWWDGR
ncbi:MAG: sulfatase-like hydrolase/transferase, partial [Opitutales bacterium]|nr:sulfatase-like hydrolase/transferase [Opitutales bacterium]